VKQHPHKAELIIVPPLHILTMLLSIKTNVSHAKSKKSFLKYCLNCLLSK